MKIFKNIDILRPIESFAKWAFGLTTGNIAQKIGYGYSLAIGIAVLGTTVGLTIGDHYQQKAQNQLLFAAEQQLILNKLHIAALKIRIHPQQLFSVIENSIWFQYETSKFSSNLSQVQNTLLELGLFLDNHEYRSIPENDEIKELTLNYSKVIENYTQLIESTWRQIDPLNITPDRVSEAQTKVLTAIAGEEAIQIRTQFEHLSENLTQTIQTAEKQQIEAHKQLKKAHDLRQQIITVSMLLSVAIATFLAIKTSQAIANPITALTKVAQKVTRESNFNLQAKVTTHDEVGVLATSLNQLIQWVAQYTYEVEEARQTLEKRVEERTQELQAALHNLKQTQAQLIQTEKMSSLGQMVAGIAHEINNPVNFIHGNLSHIIEYTHDLLELVDLYQQEYPDRSQEIDDFVQDIELHFLKEDCLKILSSMKMGTNRIKDIILSLRNFSRLDESEIKSVDLHEGLDNTLLILNHRLKLGVNIIKKYDILPLVDCYPAQLNQVFMNILSNAIDALLEGDNPNKKIIIETQKFGFDRVQVKIKDNGMGIPSEIKSKLFDPFFTTKPVGKGTGLGLSISYQIIVEKHRGKIDVFSQAGESTEFRIEIPITQHHNLEDFSLSQSLSRAC